MAATVLARAPSSAEVETDQRVVLYGMSWWQFETMLAIRGDRAGVRLAYLEGTLASTKGPSTPASACASSGSGGTAGSRS